jgi:hypothetical protein
MTVGQLKERYRDVFGEASRSNHKQFLFRRVAWRIQANAWGGLSERALRRALEIANDSVLRIRAPRNFLKEELDETRTIEAHVAPTEDPRLPIAGTDLVRRYRGKDIVVRVREDGFEYDDLQRGAQPLERGDYAEKDPPGKKIDSVLDRAQPGLATATPCVLVVIDLNDPDGAT